MNGNEIMIQTPLTKDIIKALKAGDFVSLSGTIYTARDAAHLRLMTLIEQNKSLPFDVENQIIYYVGPSPNRPGKVVGSAGPTTSYRMDDMTPPLLEMGLGAMIGKGQRNEKVIEAMKHYGAVYFAAVGGAGAMMANAIKSVEVVAYEDLGTESIKRLTVEKMPLIVVIDSEGNNLYEIEREKYRQE